MRMKVLLISNQHPNNQGVGNPIMYRMRDALAMDSRISQVDFEPAFNSIGSMLNLRRKSKEYDVIHVHFGGIYALIIWAFLISINSKKFITFHGTDIHAKALKTAKTWKEKLKIRLNQKASFLSIFLYDKCGFVAEEMEFYVPKYLSKQMQKKAFVQPLGVDYSTFILMDKTKAQKYLGLLEDHYVLFSDVSNTSIKRRDIAEAIISELGSSYHLLVMSGVKPQYVPYYINACDFAILTSDEEGSPNIIREVLSLNKSFFSVDVGDAAKQLEGLKNSGIISRTPSKAAKKILEITKKNYMDYTRTSRRDILDFVQINKRIVDIYTNFIL